MRATTFGASLALSIALAVACEAPSVSIPVKPGAVRDVDDQDDEAEEATLGIPCRTSSDCPGDENDVCSPTLGCVECTSNAQCEADEVCLDWGDCENLGRRR